MLGGAVCDFRSKRLDDHFQVLTRLVTCGIFKCKRCMSSNVSQYNTSGTPLIYLRVFAPMPDLQNAMETILRNPDPRYFNCVHISLSGGWDYQWPTIVFHVKIYPSSTYGGDRAARWTLLSESA